MLRIHSQPFEMLPAIARREGGWNASLDPALVRTAGDQAAFDRLHQPGALVVTTGQQPGLFTGPLYTVHKALAAVALAQTLEARWRCPVVPIFWIAGDDHDYAEASGASWEDTNGEVVDWSLPSRDPSAPQRSMSAEPLPLAINDGLARLEASLPVGALRDETLAWLRRYYCPGVTIHAAYAGAVAELLAPHGVLCFDPTTPAVKSAQRPWLRRALEHATAIDETLAALPDPGTGIAAGEGATLVFALTSAGRDRILIDGDGFRARRAGHRWTQTELFAALEQEPDRFSANVLLRPVVERALLPTVAYVAGPGEFRYLTRQASALYGMFGVTPQQPVPRWSGSVVTAAMDRILGKLTTTAEAIIADDESIGKALLQRDFPEDARQALGALRQQLLQNGDVIATAATRADPVLDRAMRSRLRRLDHLTDEIEGIFLRHLRKREGIAYAQYRRVRNALLPHDMLQERVLTAASFLARYGTAWSDAVLEAARRWARTLPEGPA